MLVRNSRKIIIANWKMNPPSATEARLLFARTKRVASRLENVQTVICPPFPYLGFFAHSDTTRVSLGAQDAYYSNTGRATGEVSPEMLADLGVSAVIVGHSERRALGETDEMAAKRTVAVLREGLRAIVCVGEKERDPDGRYFEILKGQLNASLAGVARKNFRELIIAYEPLFAIGKSARDAMSPRDICETTIFIRKVLTDAFGAEAAQLPPILYGGSVEKENAAAILRDGGVSGLLVGHKCLDAEEFSAILKSANAIA